MTQRGLQMIGEHLWRFSLGWFQLYIPDCHSLKQQVLLESHTAASGGHGGWNSTYEKVSRRAYWQGLQTDVQTFVAECAVCQTTKVRRKKPFGLLHPVPVPNTRWEVVSADFVNGLSGSNRDGYDSVLTLTCKHSRIVRFIPMKMGKGRSSAEQVARLFRDGWWRYYGCPRVLVSDRDARFESKFWKELSALLNIQLSMTTANNPQGNGGAERSNASMEQRLRAVSADSPTDWPEHLAAAEFSHNDSKNATTGFSPFELLYGESPKSHLDHTLVAALGTKSTHLQGRKFVQTWRENLALARERTLRAQEKAKVRFNAGRRLPTFQANDQVLLSATGFTAPHDRGMQHKMRAQWYGPFTVTKVNMGSDGTPASYQLRLPSQWHIHNTFAAHKIEEWNPAVH